MPKFFFCTTDDYPLGEVDAPGVKTLGARAEAAHRSNMDTFNHQCSTSEVSRVYDENASIVGWFNSFTGRFTSR